MDFQEIESKWQTRWYQEKAFEPSSVDASKPKFFFTVPYPYVSGTLHVGHGRTYAHGDVIARFKRMQGFNVLWPMAFHITGTPVLAISSKIAAGDQETISLYENYVKEYEADEARVKEVVASFKEPWNIVKYFSSKLVADFKTIGFSLDLSRQFTTGDKEYNKFVEWQFHKYKKKNYLKQAAYPILYCTNCRNAAGEDDIQDGDVNPVEVQEFVAFKFALPGTDEFVVSSTLRPETVFGITNMFVNPSATYVLVQAGQEKLWLSEKAAEKLALQRKEVQVKARRSGEEFVGKTLVSPLGASVPVLPAAFVDPANATGFVHSVPAHAPYDLVALRDLKKDDQALKKYASLASQLASIKPIPLIETSGYGELPAQELVEKMRIASLRETDKLDKATKELYRAEFYEGRLNSNCGEFAGRKVEEVKDEVTKKLVESGKAFLFYESSRPAKCRCGGEIVAAVLPDQWFLDFNSPGWKDRSRECLERMTVFPPNYKKQFQDIFAWLDKRPCARRRGIGTQLPFANEWIIESLSDSTIYMAFYTIIKQVRQHKIRAEQLTEEFFDYVFLGERKPQEVEKITGVPAPVLQSIRAEFNYWYPNDLRHTAVAHISNHLSFFIFAHTAIFPPKHWPRAITVNELLVREGAKMSKSKGNVIILSQVKQRYGADLFRLYVTSAADFASVLDFREKEIDSARKSLNKFAETLQQMLELREQPAGEGPAAKWMLSKFERAIQDSTTALQEFRLRDYAQRAFFDLLNAWEYFVRRASQAEKAFVAREAAERWILLLCPVIPHLCEELWHKAGNKDFASLAKWPEARLERVNDAIERGEDLVKSVLADVRAVKQLVKFKPFKAKIIVASKAKNEELASALASASKPEELRIADSNLAKYAAKNFYWMKNCDFALDEAATLQSAAEFLAREAGLQVTIEREEDSTEEKKARALPLKPAVILL